MKLYKILFILFMLFTMHPLTSLGQISLTIEISELRNNNGQILLAFTNEKGEKITGIAQSIADNKCVIVINDLKQGKYAFKYFHDENKNETLDLSWIKIPKEGFGFSNNAKGTFGPPSFGKTIFEITENTTVKCTPIYMKL